MEQVYDDVRHAATAYPQRPLPEILGQLVETQDLVFALLESAKRRRTIASCTSWPVSPAGCSPRLPTTSATRTPH